jgi:hypothetical protein
LIGWIRIRIQEGKNDPKKGGGVKKCIVFEVLDDLLERAGSFSCSLEDVLHRSRGMQFLIKKSFYLL